MNLKQLSQDVFVRGQVMPAELAELSAAGFKGVINNRPDGEAPDQPSSAELAAEAHRHGLSYWHIPIVPGQATEQDAKLFDAAVRAADGRVIGFCRSGARAESLWKMAQDQG